MATEIAVVAPPQRSLHRKLAQVMWEAERIPKNGTAPTAMGGYKFVQVGDAADFIRKALAEKVITMMPTSVRVVGQTDRPTKAGGTMTTVDLVTSWTLTDGESGESIVIESFGAGSDGGDKYSGKASTSAMKYALLTGFLLSTGEDSELGDETAGGKRKSAAPVRPLEGETSAGVFTFSGLIALKANSDGRLRLTPTGHVLAFRFETGDGKPISQVQALDADAVAINGAIGSDPTRLVGLQATVTGELFNAWFTQPGTEDKAAHRIDFQRMRLHRIETPGWTFPADETVASQAAERVVAKRAERVANDEADAAACGNVAADGLMAGATCTEPDGHKGAHKNADGSWPQ